MIDLETMGTMPGSAIVQIGAVEFSAKHLGKPFFVNVCLKSCVRVGLRMDPDTVMWWVQQSPEASKCLTEDAVPIKDALKQFTEWLCFDRPAVWGDGAAFDNVLLSSAYRACGMSPPWHYSRDRCFRTMKECFPVDQVPSALLHHASEDAVAQAKQMQSIIERYSLGGFEQTDVDGSP